MCGGSQNLDSPDGEIGRTAGHRALKIYPPGGDNERTARICRIGRGVSTSWAGLYRALRHRAEQALGGLRRSPRSTPPGMRRVDGQGIRAIIVSDEATIRLRREGV